MYARMYWSSNRPCIRGEWAYIWEQQWATYGGSPIVSPFLCTPPHLLRSLSHVRPLPSRPLPIGLSRHCTCFAKSPSYRPPTRSSSYPAQLDSRLERATEPYALIRYSLSPHCCCSSSRAKMVPLRDKLKASADFRICDGIDLAS